MLGEYWKRRILEKSDVSNNNWIKAGEKYGARIVVALFLAIGPYMFLRSGLDKNDELLIWAGIFGFIAIILFIVYNAVVGQRVVNALKERQYQSIFGMPSELNNDEDYSSTYVFRIVDESDSLPREIEESSFRSNNLEEAKRRCLYRAEHFLETSLIEWEEFDFGFFIQHGNIRVELLIDLSPLNLPDSDGQNS